jgi:feruloyl esterase
MRTPEKILAAMAFTGLLALAAGTPVSCDSLASTALPHITITSAKSVGAGEFSPPEGSRVAATAFQSLLAFCRVQASLKPGEDSDIRIEVWLPMAGWNNKLQSVGNGAWGGVIGYPALATALSQGYAAASTDTGHKGNGPS